MRAYTFVFLLLAHSAHASVLAKAQNCAATLWGKAGDLMDGPLSSLADFTHSPGYPFRSVEMATPIDDIDRKLWELSWQPYYEHGAKPVEVLALEMFGASAKEHELLFISGEPHRVPVELIQRNWPELVEKARASFGSFEKVLRVGFRHTQPGDFPAACWRFSRTDRVQSYQMRNALNQNAQLRHVDFDSSIIYRNGGLQKRTYRLEAGKRDFFLPR